MHRWVRVLVAASLAVAAGACSRDSGTLLAPAIHEGPDSLGQQAHATPNGGFVSTPSWSPYTGRLYFTDPEGLRELDLRSGAVRTLAGLRGAWVMAPSGRALYSIVGALRRFDIPTEAVTIVSDVAAWVPILSNGDAVVAYCRPSNYALLISATSGTGVEVAASRGFALAFSPLDREILYSKSPSLHPVLNHDPLQARDLRTGAVREIPIDVPGVPLGLPYWSQRGITIASADQGYTRLWIRIGQIDRVMFSNGEDIDAMSVSWSPGGTRLGFITYGYASRGRILTAWVIDLETSRLFRVAHGLDEPPGVPDPTGMPTVASSNNTTFSPDGRSLAYTSAGRIFIAPID